MVNLNLIDVDNDEDSVSSDIGDMDAIAIEQVENIYVYKVWNNCIFYYDNFFLSTNLIQEHASPSSSSSSSSIDLSHRELEFIPAAYTTSDNSNFRLLIIDILFLIINNILII